LNLLLDTHVAIWALVAPDQLAETVRELIANPANVVFVSAASVWEIAIKHALGRNDAPPFSASAAVGHFRAAGYVLLDVTPEHAAAVEELPDLHGDPFDRLLVAQAMSEPLRLVTHDRKVAAYSDSVILF
jgi:PIN domain nuclease of toxin-antitoxin system